MNNLENSKKELKDFIDKNIAVGFSDHFYIHELIDNIPNQLDSLGENARRHLEIGILADKLVGLGFKINTELMTYEGMDLAYSYQLEDDSIDVEFNFNFKDLTIESPLATAVAWWDNGEKYETFPIQNVLNKVKELINE